MQLDLSSADLQKITQTVRQSLTGGAIDQEFGANPVLGIRHIARAARQLVKEYVAEIREGEASRMGYYPEPARTVLQKLCVQTTPAIAVAETLQGELAQGLQHVVNALTAGETPNFSMTARHEVTSERIALILARGVMSLEQVDNYTERMATIQKAKDAWAGPYDALLRANVSEGSTHIEKISSPGPADKPKSVVAKFIAEGLKNPDPEVARARRLRADRAQPSALRP